MQRLLLALALSTQGGARRWLVTLAVVLTCGAVQAESLAPPALVLSSLEKSAWVDTVVEGDVPQLHARLLVSSAPERRVGVLFDLEPGWHLYWRNPGGTGIAPDLGLEADRARVGELAWPAPTTFEEADGLFTTWGYEGRVLLSAPLNQAAEGTDDFGLVRSNASVLVCRTQCVPASFSLSSKIDGALDGLDQSRVDRLFDDALGRVPVAARIVGLEASARWTAGAPAMDDTSPLELVLDACPSKSATDAGAANCPSLAESAGLLPFIPIEGETFEFEKATIARQGDKPGRVTLSVEVTRLEAGEDRLRGIVPLQDSTGRIQHVEIDLPITATSEQAAAPVAVISKARWVQAFLLALLGGLILNGMPCVLPVLAIKVFSVAEMAEKDPKEVRLHGLAYTAGVLGSMGVLAAVVLGLRSAGHSVGWGFQFQEPLFVAAISAVLVTFALNLFGVFEIELGQGRLASIGQESTGVTRSLFEGLLAVVLATPCTAPFLGTAVGFAFASSGFGIVAIFLAIGLGLASPFLAVSFFPRLARFIPRSGPWMNTFRSGLGFSLLATVVWLLWVLGQSGGADTVVAMVGALLFIGFLLWTFGQMQPLRSVWVGRATAFTIFGLAVASFNLIGFDRTAEGAGTQSETAIEEGWQTYSEAAVQAALTEGKPAFVVFTADWCITCQVNERTVLHRDSIRDALDASNFVRFKADWTRRDETIRAKLADFGRAGVPLYLVYHPDRPNDPQVLSELLTQREVLAALRETSGDSAPTHRI